MRKLFLFSAGFSTAVFSARYFLRGNVDVLAVLAGTSIIMLSLTRYRYKSAVSILLVALFCGSLWWSAYNEFKYDEALSLVGKKRTIEVIALDYPERGQYSSRLYAKTAQGGHKINLRLKSSEIIEPGDRLFIEADISVPEPTRDFDFYVYYQSKGIFLDGIQNGDISVEPAKKITPLSIPVRARHFIIGRLDILFDGNTKAILTGMLTGDSRGISTGFRQRLSATGLSHIIAVSGMHVSFLLGIVNVFFKKSKITPLVSLPLMVFFVLMTGAAPSAVRACVMQLIVLIGTWTSRENDPLTSLSAALLFLLVINPFSISDIGMQLSFLATLGLVLFSQPVRAALLRRIPKRVASNKLVSLTVDTLAATFAATVLTALPVSYYFNRLSLIAPVGNLLVLWVLPAVFAGGILCVCLSMVSLKIGSLIAFFVSFPVKYVETVINTLGKLPYASLDTGNPYVMIWMTFVFVLGLSIYFSKRSRRLNVYAGCALAASLLLTLLVSEIDFSSSDMRIRVIDIGQGQSIAAFSGSHTLIVDCGGDRWQGTGNIVGQYLLDNNRRRVDLLVLTHTHLDHAGGVEDLLDYVDIKYLALPDTEAAAPYAEEFEQLGINVIRINTSFKLDMGKNAVTVYRPIVRKSGDEEGIVIKLSSGGFDMLVTGDLDETSERIFIEREGVDGVDLLIAGHHGSGRSTSDMLLEVCRPKVCAISAGAGNSYGHPSPKALARIEAHDIPVYRTDLDGSIDIKIRTKNN